MSLRERVSLEPSPRPGRSLLMLLSPSSMGSNLSEPCTQTASSKTLRRIPGNCVRGKRVNVQLSSRVTNKRQTLHVRPYRIDCAVNERSTQLEPIRPTFFSWLRLAPIKKNVLVLTSAQCEAYAADGFACRYSRNGIMYPWMSNKKALSMITLSSTTFKRKKKGRHEGLGVE